MANPTPAIGTLLQQGDGATPENFTTIAGVETITAGLKTVVVDVTNQDSPDRFLQRFPVLVDADGLKFPLILDPLDGGHDELRAALIALTPFHVRMLLPVSPQKKRLYTIFVEDFGETFSVKDVMRAAVTLTNYQAPNYALA